MDYIRMFFTGLMILLYRIADYCGQVLDLNPWMECVFWGARIITILAAGLILVILAIVLLLLRTPSRARSAANLVILFVSASGMKAKGKVVGAVVVTAVPSMMKKVAMPAVKKAVVRYATKFNQSKK